MTLSELKKNVGNKKLILGLNRTVKEMKKGNVNEIFLASNCSMEMKKDIEAVAKKFKIKISELDVTNEEMGVVVKKPFAVSVACLLK